MDTQRILEELNIRGAAAIGSVLSSEDVQWFRNDLNAKKQEDINEFGKEALIANFALETVQDLGRFAGKYYDLIANSKINEVINTSKLIKIIDVLGREKKQTNQLLFYIYNDGTVEKKIIIE